MIQSGFFTMPNLAYLSLGSNIKPQKNIRAAIQWLTQLSTIKAISNIWETTPVGFLEQPNFLNAAVLIETEQTAEMIKATVIQTIERALHRVRTDNPNAPRTIDLDIALFNNEILTLGKSQIPDPGILLHAFVAVPLAEIAPDYIHPITGQTLTEIASKFDLNKEGLVKLGPPGFALQPKKKRQT